MCWTLTLVSFSLQNRRQYWSLIAAWSCRYSTAVARTLSSRSLSTNYRKVRSMKTLALFLLDQDRPVACIYSLLAFRSAVLHTHTHTHSRFMALWVHGWAGTRRDIHSLTPEMCYGSLSSFWILWGVRKIMEAGAPTIRLDATHSRPSMPPPPSSPNFMPDALPAATLPIYAGLGQAPNMLDCIPGGL